MKNFKKTASKIILIIAVAMAVQGCIKLDEEGESNLTIDFTNLDIDKGIPSGETFYINGFVECSGNYDAIKSYEISLNGEIIESYITDDVRANQKRVINFLFEWDVPYNVEVAKLQFKAEAMNGGSSEREITLNVGSGWNIVYDIDGNCYNTVNLGEQTWMAENLKTSRYSDGTYLQTVMNSNWVNVADTGRVYCYYDSDRHNLETYGALYNWKAVMNGAQSDDSHPGEVQGICPKGWHVPSVADWHELEYFLINNGYNFDESIEENKIGKSLAYSNLWDGNNTTGNVGNNSNSNNSSGFSAFPAGARNNNNGEYFGLGSSTFWWTSTQIEEGQIWLRGLQSYNHSLINFTGDKTFGASVRCLKD